MVAAGFSSAPFSPPREIKGANMAAEPDPDPQRERRRRGPPLSETESSMSSCSVGRHRRRRRRHRQRRRRRRDARVVVEIPVPQPTAGRNGAAAAMVMMSSPETTRWHHVPIFPQWAWGPQPALLTSAVLPPPVVGLISGRMTRPKNRPTVTAHCFVSPVSTRCESQSGTWVCF